MPTIREIMTANRQRADSMTDDELAAHIAAKPAEQQGNAIRNLSSAYRPTGGFDYELHPTKLIPANPVGELLELAYQVEQGRRGPLAAAEIKPVVIWLRANALPIPPAPASADE